METISATRYYCPMHCEGEKTYDQPGDCPVCNMHLVPVEEINEPSGGDKAKHDHEHRHKTSEPGKNKYYCPMGCEGDKTYDKPGDCPVCGMHLKKVESVSSSKTIYICPMHPEVKQDKPGSCPKCGMDLVPEKGEETSEEELAYKKMLRRFWIALIFTIPVFIIAMSDMFLFMHLDKIRRTRSRAGT